MGVLPACMYVCHIHAWNFCGPEESVGSPGTGEADACEPTYGC